MDYKEIQNDNIQSALIKVQTLQQEYEVTLQQYQESGKNFINYLKNTSEEYSNSTEYTALQSRAWWGTTGNGEGTVETQEECENMCSSSVNCTGATFNPVKRYCWTRTGEGSVSAGQDTDVALIPKQKAAIIVMKGLNEKLLNINEQIKRELKNINPQVQQLSQEKNIKQQQLNKSYEQLLEQKLEMEKQLQEYYSIEEETQNQSLYVNQENVSLRFLVLITCLILIVTLKKLYGLESAPINVIIKVLIGIILIILTYSLSSPSGFAIWFVVLLVVVLVLILKKYNQTSSL